MLEKIKYWIKSLYEEDDKEDIPKNLSEAVKWLEDVLPKEQKKKIADGTADNN
jgi:hypothetical protein